MIKTFGQVENSEIQELDVVQLKVHMRRNFIF